MQMTALAWLYSFVVCPTRTKRRFPAIVWNRNAQYYNVYINYTIQSITCYVIIIITLFRIESRKTVYFCQGAV